MQVISRDAARAAGLKRYFTGEPCRNGHVSERYARDGLCRACVRASIKRYEATEHGRKTRNASTTALRRRNPVRALLSYAKRRAKIKGLPFDLVIADIAIPSRCPVLDIPLSLGCGFQHPGSPSLDRLKPHLGYVRGNVSVISFRANSLKSNASAGELQAVAEWVKVQELI